MQQTMSDPRHFWLFANHFPCSIPVGDSDFFFVPSSRHVEHSIFSHFPCVCQLEKSRLTSGDDNLNRVTSDNSEHSKIIRISNILVSSVETTKQLKIHKRNRGGFRGRDEGAAAPLFLVLLESFWFNQPSTLLLLSIRWYNVIIYDFAKRNQREIYPRWMYECNGMTL